MELCQKQSLGDIRRTEKAGCIGPYVGARYGMEIIRVIKALHDQNLVHRDIKPVSF